MALRVLGAMSGTSLDGVDAAVVETDGVVVHGFGPTAYRPYTGAERQTLRDALGHWEGPTVEAATRVVTNAHAELLGGFDALDLVGFHGQTLAHAPRDRGTLQAGDGADLARTLEVPVAWDFRSADVAAGGEGAPLAPLFHHTAARWAGLSGPGVVLNLGGVGNLTWLDADAEPEAPGALLAFDTGPANAPLDDLVATRTGAGRDEGGALASAGRADERIVARFRESPYLTGPPPKSLDRGNFSWLAAAVADLATEDAAATLVAVCAAGVAAGLALCPARPKRVLVTGGGRHNAAMMDALGAAADAVFVPIEAVSLDGDMLEAQAFAFLAARVLHGLPLTLPGTTGVAGPLPGGRLTYP
jgi:anhydro-N-acetylmuramic acid kinase